MNLPSSSELQGAQRPLQTPPRRNRSGLDALDVRRTGAAPRRESGGYSRFVVSMKLVLPILALLLIGLVVVWPQLQGVDHRFRIGFSGTDAREAADLNMVNARYMGTDAENRPFTITADIARNLTPSARLVNLELPKADIVLEDGTWLVMTADTGEYDQTAKTLLLKGGVNMFHDTGYEMNTSSAIMDLSSGDALGKEPVAGQGPFGELRSEGFRMIDKGKKIIFTGKAHLVVLPNAGGEARQ
ncbi:MAG: LPS export ABC transporter periplasmic protein LptC [Rhodospirillales bacterium]|nr:LPS export ABC transporter periplasmic protein LptC [Rhodospirillales bacterium]MCW9001570.1 LPS export ABC transporter periplasmic protein LptC [Rhodospirillales bacterium]